MAARARIGGLGIVRAGWWTPILILEAYLTITVGVFFFGPIDWFIPSATKLSLFLAANYGALALGYWLGIRSGRAARARRRGVAAAAPALTRPMLRLLVVCMLFNIATTIVKVHAIRGLGTVLSTISAPGAAYNESQVTAQMSRDRELAGQDIMRYSWAFRIDTVFGALSQLYLPLGFIYWRRLRTVWRGTFIGSLFCSVLFTLGLGAQSGVGFLLFSSLPVALFKYYSVPAGAETSGLDDRALRRASEVMRRRIRVAALALLLVLVATVAGFQIARAEEGEQPPDVVRALVREFGVPSSDGLLRVTGTRGNYGLVMAALYASHGYTGLALSMELPFEWTFGLGWSKALQAIYHDYLGGPDMFERSYLARNQNETGWPALTWWSTIFPWLASDITFFGTPLFTLLVGLSIARCWVDARLTGNPMSLAVLGQLFILVFMFPANNAVAQTLGGFFAFVGVVVAYGLSRRSFPVPGMRRAVTAREAK